MSEGAREKLVAHRVTDEEFADLALVAKIRGVSRSELLRALVRIEKRRIAVSPDLRATGEAA